MPEPSVVRFVARHARPHREAVAADAAPYVGMSPDERARHVDAACRLAAEAVLASPWRDRALGRREPPDLAWTELSAGTARDRRRRVAEMMGDDDPRIRDWHAIVAEHGPR